MFHVKIPNKQQSKEPSLEDCFKRFSSSFRELLKRQQADEYTLVNYTQIPDDITGVFKKLSTTWILQGESYDFWWEFQYDRSVKTLSISAFVTENYRMSIVNGCYHINLAVNLFQRYSKELALNNQNFQFNINPLTGTIKILSKVLIKQEQYKLQIVKSQYMFNIYCELVGMLQMLKKLILLHKYFDGKLKSCPVLRFLKEEINVSNTISSQVFLKAIHKSLNEVDHNCEESLESFGNSQYINQFVNKYKIQLPLEMSKVISKIGLKKDYEQEDFQQTNITEIIGQIYEASLMNDSALQSGILVKKIKILTPPHQINWKPFAYGGFGKIEKATIKYQLYDFSNKNVEMAVGQIVRKSDTHDTNKIQHEHKILHLIKNQQHANIMPYFISQQSIYKHFVFSKYEPNLSLDKYMRVNKKTLSLQTVTRLMEHTLKGLMFLKEKNIAHLDMKPNNIIVSSDLSAKLSDFGQAFHFEEDPTKHLHGFTIPYVSPEVFYEEPYLNSKVDVYSFGVTMYKVLFGDHIWGQIRDRDKFKQDLVQNLTPPLKMVPEALFKYGVKQIIGTLVNLCLRCIKRDQSQRPSLFYLSVLLSLCRFYIYSLIDGTYKPQN